MAGKNNNQPAIAKEVKNIVIQASEAILKGVDRMFEEQNKRIDERFKRVDERFKQVDERFNRLEVEVSYIKDTLNGLKADLADTPSRREFEELKARVDKYHPLQ